MKTKILLLVSLFVVATASGQTYEQNDFVLDGMIPEDKDVIYEATTSIKLMDGFSCNPGKNKSVLLHINRFNVLPPEGGIIGGPPGAGNDGVVGALPGNFDISEFGGGVYSIPIQMPNGIGDMTPHITVTYNNQAGNGLLGWGWNLSGLSSIVRTGQTVYHDGQETSVNFNTDRFVLDGKRLMLCNGNYGENNSVYKTEIDEMSKIVAYTDGYNGPSRFIVYKMDGTIWEYGGTDDSRIEPQNRNDVVLTWLVNKISDRDGNCIVFNYTENQSEGEWNINNICYTLNENAGISAMFQVDFVYENRSDIEYGYECANIVKRTKILKNIIINNMMTGDVLYNYSFGYLAPGNYDDSQYTIYYRLRTVGLTAKGMKLNPTVISWNSKNKHYPNKFESFSLNKNVFDKVPFVGDFNGDGYSDVALVPYKTGNAYQNDVSVELHLNNGDGTFDNNPYYVTALDKTLEWIYVVDINGDGLDDLIPMFVNANSQSNWKSMIYGYLNMGDTFQYIGAKVSDRYFVVYPGDFCNEKKTCFYVDYPSDSNSDLTRFPEIVYCNNNMLQYQSFGMESLPASHTVRAFVADINSDGSSELMLMKNSSSLIAKITKENNQYVFHAVHSDSNFDSDDFMFPGDFNGDGHVDVLKYDNRTYWKIALSDGIGLQTPVSCLNNSLLNGLALVPQDYYYCSLQNLSMPSVTIRTADFDGDGKTDVAVFKNSGGNYYVNIGFKMYQKTNGSFDFGEIKRYYLNINNSHQYVHVGNFLGRENASVLGSVRSNPYTYEIPKIVALNPQSARYSVERITDGLGNARGFRYEYLMPNNSNSYGYDYQWVDDDLRTVTVPIRALYADTTFSANNMPCVTQYAYNNMLYHNNGRGFLGFQAQMSKCFINNVLYRTEIVENDMDLLVEHNVVLPQRYIKYGQNNQIIDKERCFYNNYICNYNNLIIKPLLVCKKTECFDNCKSGSLLKVKIENQAYQSDMSGGYYADVINVGHSITGEDASYMGNNAMMCSYWTMTDYLYSNNVNNWVISRPQRIIKSQHYMDNDDVGSCELFEYSNSNPYHVYRKIMIPNTGVNYNDPLKLDVEYSYDVVGNVVAQKLTSPSSKTQKIKRVYYGPEYNYRLPTASVNEKGWMVQNTYENSYGNLISTSDYNNFETDSESDPFEIVTENILPGNIKVLKTKRWAYGNEHSPNNALYYSWEKSSGKAENIVFFNKKGQKLREVSFGLYAEPIYVDYAYDDIGNVISKTNPYKPGDDIVAIYYVYDNNNRLVEEYFPNGLVQTYDYNQLQKTVSSVSPDGVNHTVVETYNPMGWRTQVIDIGGNSLNYEYYSDGKLKSVTIGNNASTKVEYEYDNLRNVSLMRDPACGEVSYEYNAFGELVRTTNPKQCVTTYLYDELGNVVMRHETDAKGANTIVTQWVYDDSKGKMGMLKDVVCGQSHVLSYDYDDLLRITNVNETINGDVYLTLYTYDNANREETVTYPSGITIRKVYSNSGVYKGVANTSDNSLLWLAESANAMGYITDFQCGNGLKTQMEYDNKSNCLNHIYTYSDDNVYQNLKYTYDVFGNLTNRTKLNGSVQNESFIYDEFNRLVEIKKNNALTGIMEYDNYGNILSKTADKKDVFYDAQYDSSNPYAISSAKSDFDDLTAKNQNLEYTIFDKMSHVTYGNNSLSIDYGFDRERIRSDEIENDVTKEKVYVADCEYVTVNGKTVIYTFLKGPMGVFAVCCTDDKGDNTINYIHKDNMKSWCLITDNQGKVLQNISFDAWGNPRNGDNWSEKYKGDLMYDRGFTGHEHLSAFSIVNMNGRAYDPLMSMMLSPDSQIQNLDFSQNFNRYSYCYNNPLSYCDPSGEWVEWLLYGLFNGAINVVCNYEDIDSFAEGALLFGAGFVSGCLTQGLSECSWSLQVVGGVTGATLKSGVNSLVKQNKGSKIDWSLVGTSTFKEDVMYSFGSNLAKSVLNAYLVQPTDSDEGKTIGSILCKDKVHRRLVETASKKIVGNIFAGRNAFDGFGITKKNWEDAMPYVDCLAEIVSNNLVFETSSQTLSNISEKVLNFDFSGVASKYGTDVNYCYSQFRALFTKKGK